jgi:hypothetical protein
MVLNPNSPKFPENKLTPYGKHGFNFPLQFCGFKSLEKKFKILVIIFKFQIPNSKKHCHYNVKICHKKEKKRATPVGNFFENINENCKKKP